MSDERPIVIINNTYNTVNRTVNITTNNFFVVTDERDRRPILYRCPQRVSFVNTMIEAIKALTRKKPPPGDEDELLRSV